MLLPKSIFSYIFSITNFFRYQSSNHYQDKVFFLSSFFMDTRTKKSQGLDVHATTKKNHTLVFQLRKYVLQYFHRISFYQRFLITFRSIIRRQLLLTHLPLPLILLLLPHNLIVCFLPLLPSSVQGFLQFLSSLNLHNCRDLIRGIYLFIC